MTYPTIRNRAGRAWWSSWHLQSMQVGERIAPPPAPESELHSDTNGEKYSELVANLIRRLELLFEKRGTSELPSNDRFEAEAAAMLHSGLNADLVVSDPGFWIWMAIAPGASLIEKRYPATDKKLVPDLSNFSSPNARETFFYRLWARGYLGFDASLDDPYYLARSGDIDFWRSHILRQSLTEAREFRHALIRFQYPEGPGSEPRLKISGIRNLIKRLKRSAANINIEMLDSDKAERMILRECERMQEDQQ